MTVNRILLTYAEIVYYIYFSVMTLAKGLGLYDGMWPYTLSLYIGFALVILKLIITEHTLGEWLFIVGMMALAVITYKNSGQTGAFIYITMLIAMKGTSVKRIYSIGLFIWSLTFVFLTLLTITGLKSDIIVVHEKLGLGHLVRWSLGQPHPNVLQITFLMICALFLYLANYKGKKLIYTTLIMLIANLYIFLYSISYTGLILVVFYLFSNLYLSFRGTLNWAEQLLALLVFPLCAAFAILGPVLFQGELWEFCNRLLNTRFNIARHHLTIDPIPLLGARASDLIPANLHNIDSSYVFALMRYGLIFFLLMSLGYLALIYNCIKKHRHTELAIILGLSVAAIAEPFFVNPSYKNISVIFLGAFIFDQFHQFAQVKPNHILNRKIRLCSVGSTELSFSTTYLMSLKEQFLSTTRIHGKRILLVGLIASVLSCVLFVMTENMPEKYYMLDTSTDGIRAEPIYIDINNLPDDFEGRILNYIDPDTPMQVFGGTLADFEYLRAVISVILWPGLFAMLLFSVLLTHPKSSR